MNIRAKVPSNVWMNHSTKDSFEWISLNQTEKTKSDKSPHYYVYVYWHLLSDFSRINHKTKYKSCCHSSQPPPSLRIWLVGGIMLKSFQALRITEAQAWLRAALWTTDICETGWQISAAGCTLSGSHWRKGEESVYQELTSWWQANRNNKKQFWIHWKHIKFIPCIKINPNPDPKHDLRAFYKLSLWYCLLLCTAVFLLSKHSDGCFSSKYVPWGNYCKY